MIITDTNDDNSNSNTFSINKFNQALMAQGLEIVDDGPEDAISIIMTSMTIISKMN